MRASSWIVFPFLMMMATAIPTTSAAGNEDMKYDAAAIHTAAVTTYTKDSFLNLVCGKTGCGGRTISGQIQERALHTILCNNNTVRLANVTVGTGMFTDASISVGSALPTVMLGTISGPQITVWFRTDSGASDYTYQPSNAWSITVDSGPVDSIIYLFGSSYTRCDTSSGTAFVVALTGVLSALTFLLLAL